MTWTTIRSIAERSFASRSRRSSSTFSRSPSPVVVFSPWVFWGLYINRDVCCSVFPPPGEGGKGFQVVEMRKEEIGKNGKKNRKKNRKCGKKKGKEERKREVRKKN